MSVAGRGRGRGRGRGWYSKCVDSEGVLGTTSPPNGKPSPTQEQRPGPATRIVRPQYDGKQTNAAQYKEQRGTGGDSLKQQPPQQPTQKQPPQQPVDLKAIKQILEKCYERKESETAQLILTEVQKNPSRECMQELVSLICEKSLHDSEFGVIGAEICNRIWLLNELRKTLQSPLLTTVQKYYSNRKDLELTMFFGLAVLLCELFKRLRLKDLALQPLNKPVCEVLMGLIEDETPSEDQVCFFLQEIESVGSTIESVSVDSMEEIINKVRHIIISNETILPSTRCRLVQVVELRTSKWKLADDVKILYDDLNQDLMSEGR